MKELCNRPCPTPGYLPCNRTLNHLNPCAHRCVFEKDNVRDLNKEERPPLWLTFVVWLVLVIWSLTIVGSCFYSMVNQ